MPPEDLQTPMFDADGLIGYADFRWKGVVGEFDGKKKYKVPEGADADDGRGGALAGEAPRGPVAGRQRDRAVGLLRATPAAAAGEARRGQPSSAPSAAGSASSGRSCAMPADGSPCLHA